MFVSAIYWNGPEFASLIASYVEQDLPIFRFLRIIAAFLR